MSSFESIRLAIEGRMAQWSGAPVAYDGVPNSPTLQAAIDNKESWVRCVISHGDSAAPYKGSEPGIRRIGILRLNISTPLDRGSRPAALLADSLAEHFQFYRSGALELLTASVDRTGPDDGWYRYTVRIPWRAG